MQPLSTRGPPAEMGDFATFIANSWNHEDDMNGVAGDALNLTCFLVRTTD